MISQVGVDEVAEHLRQEVRRLNGGAAPPASGAEVSPPGAAFPLPPSLPPPPSDALFLEGIAAEAGNLISRARFKLTVKPGVPKWLRPLFRNQGGYNEVVLKTLDLLGDIVCRLAAENERLREHAIRQEAWMQDAVRVSRALHARLSVLEQRRKPQDTPEPPAAAEQTGSSAA